MDLDGGHSAVEQVDSQKVLETILGACLFPSREYPYSVTFRHPGIAGTPPLRVMVTVEYRGVSETVYRTSVEFERTPSEQRQRTRAT